MASSYRLSCCLCRRPIGQRADVYALDAEWQRRYPEMVGNLACSGCALTKHAWRCDDARGRYIDGHVRAIQRTEPPCLDSWDHIAEYGTRAAMVLLYPRSGLLQGAESAVRRTARSKRGDAELIARARDAVDDWDAMPTDRTRTSP